MSSKSDNRIDSLDLEAVLLRIGVSGTTERIYRHLLERGPSSARNIAETIGLPRPTVYDGLRSLIGRSLVLESEQNYKKIFSVGDPLIIEQILKDQTDSLQEARTAFTQMLPHLGEQARTIEPKVSFFSGKEEVKQVANDLYWYKNTEIRVITNISNMMETLGHRDFERAFKKRIERGNSVRAIWSCDSIPNLSDIPWFKPCPENLFEVRIAPKKETWEFSSRAYAERVTFISSTQELFAFRVHSKEFAATMKAQFELLWEQSTPFTKHKEN